MAKLKGREQGDAQGTKNRQKKYPGFSRVTSGVLVCNPSIYTGGLICLESTLMK